MFRSSIYSNSNLRNKTKTVRHLSFRPYCSSFTSSVYGPGSPPGCMNHGMLEFVENPFKSTSQTPKFFLQVSFFFDQLMSFPCGSLGSSLSIHDVFPKLSQHVVCKLGCSLSGRDFLACTKFWIQFLGPRKVRNI